MTLAFGLYGIHYLKLIRGAMPIDIDYDSLRHRESGEPKCRVDLDKYVVSFNSTSPTARTARHAWNPRNKRAVCGAAVLDVPEPVRLFGDSDADFNCITCQRQWSRWVTAVDGRVDREQQA